MCSNNWPLKTTTSLKGTNLPNCKCTWVGPEIWTWSTKQPYLDPQVLFPDLFIFFGNSLLILGRKLLISCEIAGQGTLMMRWYEMKHLSEKWSPRKLIWNFPSNIRLTREFSPWRFLPKKNDFALWGDENGQPVEIYCHASLNVSVVLTKENRRAVFFFGGGR